MEEKSIRLNESNVSIRSEKLYSVDSVSYTHLTLPTN